SFVHLAYGTFRPIFLCTFSRRLVPFSATKSGDCDTSLYFLVESICCCVSANIGFIPPNTVAHNPVDNKQANFFS
ncbi:hypothetical protein, partial [Bacillus cereus]|uniref:hypothetical protein n=1 Tax=Bacillus cereus TaxID=1396 RepID=UPI001E2A064F